MNGSRRLERLKPLLACPGCEGDLRYSDTEALCPPCKATYPIRNGKIYFVHVPGHHDDLDALKNRLKWWLGGAYYSIGVRILAPTYPFNFGGYLRRHLDMARQIVVDAGSGNHRLDDDIICVDIFDYPAVDVVCDLAALPFKASSVDAVVSRSVLEHVPEPVRVVGNFHRVTRPGGLNFHLIPFLFPFHASPHDYQRYTHKGIEYLFKDWLIVDQFNPTGPVTLSLLLFIEFLSILLGLGRKKPKAFLNLFFCSLLFPLKYLDFLFVRRKIFLTLAPTIFTVVKKPT